MRTAADLARYAAVTGCKLVSTRRLPSGHVVGEYVCPDALDGDPMAPARLLEAMSGDDPRLDPIDPRTMRALRASSSPAEAAHALVQKRVRFEDEPVELFATPSHTLAAGSGDCDDSERVLLSLARQLGYPARYVYFLQQGSPAHVTVQVYDRGAWRWGETTIAARYGEHPFAAMKRLGIRRADLDGVPWAFVNGIATPLGGTMQGIGRHLGFTGARRPHARRVQTIGSLPAGAPSYLGSNFDTALVALAQSMGADPLDLAKLMLSESGLQPTAYNQGGGAAGINQLMPMNYGYFAPLSLSQYLGLTAEQQLPYAGAYFKNVMANHSLKSISGRDLYWLNYLPATFVAFATDDHVIVQSSSPYYNAPLDHGNKGYITAGDMQKQLDAQPAAHPTLWPIVSQAVLQTEGGVSLPDAVGVLALAALAGVMIVRPDLVLDLVGA